MQGHAAGLHVFFVDDKDRGRLRHLDVALGAPILGPVVLCDDRGGNEREQPDREEHHRQNDLDQREAASCAARRYWPQYCAMRPSRETHMESFLELRVST